MPIDDDAANSLNNPNPTKSRPLCADCNVDTGQIHEWYIVKDDVWEQAWPGTSEQPVELKYILCIGCLETRLGRLLTRRDFELRMADWPKSQMSNRLLQRLQEPQKGVDKLTQQILDDRAKQTEREVARQQERQRTQTQGPWWRDSIGFDPYQVTKWRTITGPDPSHMPRTPMRQGSIGFYVHCKACNAEFESKGWAYCPKCMELPAEERHAMKPAFSGRMCQGPRCENPIPRTARAGSKYCSKACRQRASYSTDKPPPDD